MKTLEQVIEQMKVEILEDVSTGRVPKTVASFSELHDYVDANCYGGFCDDDYMKNAWGYDGFMSDDECPDGIQDKVVAFCNAAQDAIDTWIRDGGIEL